jgi:hypothetical protein
VLGAIFALEGGQSFSVKTFTGYGVFYGQDWRPGFGAAVRAIRDVTHVSGVQVERHPFSIH